MAPLYHIELNLAREPGHPDGDSRHAYHLYLPLTPDGRLDAESWRLQKPLCHVTRTRPNEEAAHGRILHGPGGRWYFDYTDAGPDDDEAGYRLETERFVPGEYVSIREDDGHLHVFKVVAVSSFA